MTLRLALVTCDGEVRSEVGRAFYTIVKVDGDKLYFGDYEHDISDPDNRPPTLDAAFRTKKP